ncbi:MAG: hypothetical protein ACOC56_05850 [Atribacterota bacterium]
MSKEQFYLDLNDNEGTRILLSPKAAKYLVDRGYKPHWEFDDGGAVQVFGPFEEVIK